MTALPAASRVLDEYLDHTPHGQYAVPRIPLADIEWQLARSNARRLIGDDLLADVAGRVGMTPEEALDHLATAPRWVLPGETSHQLDVGPVRSCS